MVTDSITNNTELIKGLISVHQNIPVKVKTTVSLKWNKMIKVLLSHLTSKDPAVSCTVI